jgi:hypothetical protein
MKHLPDYYRPNSHLSLRFSQGDLLLAVVQAFTPFTTHQVFLVRSMGDRPGIGLRSGSHAIAKVYDPRFFSHRYQDKDELRPWSYTAEAEAAEKRPSHPISEFEPVPWPDEGDSVGWEEWYYQYAELGFRSESEAYRLLAPLQGNSIPRCFGTGSLILAEPRAIIVHVILLEYIPDAETLGDIDPSLITPRVVESLLETARVFGQLGVSHNDLNPGDILFSPGGRPTRAIVIDFGSSYVREEESDEKWAAIVKENNDPRWMERRLKFKLGLKDLAGYLASNCGARAADGRDRD